MAGNVTHACRLEHAPNADLMAAFSREANNKLREFAPQNISNMLWAYATLGHSPGDTSLSIAVKSKPPLSLSTCCVALQFCGIQVLLCSCHFAFI